MLRYIRPWLPEALTGQHLLMIGIASRMLLLGKSGVRCSKLVPGDKLAAPYRDGTNWRPKGEIHASALDNLLQQHKISEWNQDEKRDIVKAWTMMEGKILNPMVLGIHDLMPLKQLFRIPLRD